jgi:hypothetical protein
MSRAKQATDLADALESLSAGNLSEREFRAKYQTAEDPALLLRVIWPNLEHYLADADIRERDPKYRAMQKAEMGKLITRLRAGAPDYDLLKIHFLGNS